MSTPQQPIFYIDDSESFDKEIQQLLEQLNDTTKPQFIVSMRNFFKKVFDWIKKMYKKSPLKINKERLKQEIDNLEE